MTSSRLQEHRFVWEEKPVLRAIYQDFYRRILNNVCPGRTLEIGGGSGNLKGYLKDVISTDIVNTSWLDATCDAQALPFSNHSFDNIVGIDVLHHIERPIRFFNEAERILNKGGRIILLEPAITYLSWFFYHFLHPEPVILNTDPLENGPLNLNRKPFDANQAIPELIFGKHLDAFTTNFPNFSILKKEYFSLWCYPLSGGFRKWSVVPNCFVEPFLKFEKRLEKLLGRMMGFRLLVIIQKIKDHD